MRIAVHVTNLTTWLASSRIDKFIVIIKRSRIPFLKSLRTISHHMAMDVTWVTHKHPYFAVKLIMTLLITNLANGKLKLFYFWTVKSSMTSFITLLASQCSVDLIITISVWWIPHIFLLRSFTLWHVIISYYLNSRFSLWLQLFWRRPSPVSRVILIKHL